MKIVNLKIAWYERVGNSFDIIVGSVTFVSLINLTINHKKSEWALNEVFNQLSIQDDSILWNHA